MNAERFSHTVLAASIPPGGKHVRIEANASERRRLADAVTIPEVTSLTADLEVKPVGDRAFSVRGVLNASVVQTDVVTLEPTAQEVVEEIDLTLRPAEDLSAGAKEGEALVDPSEATEADVYHEGRIDIGHVVTEHLALGLDPYPRAPGVVFDGYVEDDPKADPSPFAALASLKRSDD